MLHTYILSNFFNNFIALLVLTLPFYYNVATYIRKCKIRVIASQAHALHCSLAKLLYITVYSTKVSRDKTFAVRSPCEHSWKNFRVCISIEQNDVLKISKSLNILKFTEKHSRFKENCEYRASFVSRTFCTIQYTINFYCLICTY